MLRRLVASLVVVSMLGAFGVRVDAQTPESTASATPVVIDSDMISDDWMATLAILNDPQFDVQAITVAATGFAADCAAGTRAALGLLALTGHDGVPVACGSETPLQGTNAPPAEWLTTLEMVDALGLPEGGKPVAEAAVTLFTNTILDSDEPVTVLALGPLTNVGAALEATPELAEQIEMIYIMGGAVDVDGSFVSDANTTAEWNIYCDPLGARLTFESGVPITLVSLDATNEAPVTPEFVAQLEAEKTSPSAEFVAKVLAANEESIASGSYYFWDPLAAAIMAHPEMVTLTLRDVTVIDLPGDPQDGRTKPVANGSEILVATNPDATALEAALIEKWNAA